MTKDFTPGMDRPLWPLSSYGPSKYESNLLTGLDESPEELRVRATTSLKSGLVSEYVRWSLFTSVTILSQMGAAEIRVRQNNSG
jgi:hypothetical protein